MEIGSQLLLARRLHVPCQHKYTAKKYPSSRELIIVTFAKLTCSIQFTTLTTMYFAFTVQKFSQIRFLHTKYDMNPFKSCNYKHELANLKSRQIKAHLNKTTTAINRGHVGLIETRKYHAYKIKPWCISGSVFRFEQSIKALKW